MGPPRTPPAGAAGIDRSGDPPGPLAVSSPTAPPRRGLWKNAGRRLVRNRLAVLGLGLVCAEILGAVLAPVIAVASPLALNLSNQYAPPSVVHPFGTDEFGRDVLSRTLYGIRYDLGIAVTTVAMTTAAGSLIGASSAYLGGAADATVMRIVDVLLAFPAFLLGLALVAFLGPSLSHVILVLAVAQLPRYLRLTRGAVLSVKHREYIEAARAVGVSLWTMTTRHILPNAIAPLIVYATLDLGTVITALAGLSFLGVGVQPPTPEWGLMLTNARNNLVVAPWTAVFPGLAISITVVAFNTLGDGLRDALDPRLEP